MSDDSKIDWGYFRSRISKCLIEDGVKTLGDLKKKTDLELRQIKGIGPDSVYEIHEYLKAWTY